MADEKRFKLLIETGANTGGITETGAAVKKLEGEIDGLNKHLEDSQKEFDLLFGELKEGLLAKVLPEGDRQALSSALDEMRGKLETAFQTGDLETFAREMEAVVEGMNGAADAADAWDPSEDAARWQQRTEAVKGHTESLKVSRESVGQMSTAVGALAVAMATGESPAKQLVTGITALATVAGGPVVGGLVAGLGSLITNLMDAEAQRSKLDLAQLKADADAATAAMTALGRAITEDFSKALEEQQGKLAAFTADAEAAMGSLDKGYGKLDQQAAADLELKKAQLEDQRQQTLAGADPADRAAIDADYKKMAADLEREAKFASIDRSQNKNDQMQAEAMGGISAADEDARQAKAMIEQGKAQQAEAEAAKQRLASDQERQMVERMNQYLKVPISQAPTLEGLGTMESFLQRGGMSQEQINSLYQTRNVIDSGGATWSPDGRSASEQQALVDAEERRKQGQMQEQAGRDEAAKAEQRRREAEQRAADLRAEREVIDTRAKAELQRDDTAQQRPWREGAKAANDADAARVSQAADKAGSEVATASRETSDSVTAALNDMAGALKGMAEAVKSAAQLGAEAKSIALDTQRLVEGYRAGGKY